MDEIHNGGNGTHGADIYHEDDGVLPTCQCGWEGTKAPTFDQAADAYAEHRLATASVDRAVAHIKAVHERCGTRLVQVDADYPIEGFGNGDVDIEYLVRDVLKAAHHWPQHEGER